MTSSFASLFSESLTVPPASHAGSTTLEVVSDGSGFQHVSSCPLNAVPLRRTAYGIRTRLHPQVPKQIFTCVSKEKNPQ